MDTATKIEGSAMSGNDKMRELLTRIPTKEFEVQLPASAIEEFRERGFTRFSAVTTDEEIQWLREVYDLLFSGEVPLPEGTLVNDVNRPLSEQRGQLNGQLLYPETFHPGLRRTLLYRNTQSLARQLFGTQELQGWSHLARKAPRMTEDLPWHQDEAYWDPTFDYQSAAFWMPLDTATMESGAMSFLPGSHKGNILHCSFPNNDPTRTTVLIDEEFDRSAAVPQPIPIGGVSIHHCRTLHASGPNLTDAARRAYIHIWGRKPVKREISHDRPWYWQKVLKNSTMGVVQSRRDDVEKTA